MPSWPRSCARRPRCLLPIGLQQSGQSGELLQSYGNVPLSSLQSVTLDGGRFGPGCSHQGLSPSPRRPHQHLLLRSPVSEQLEQVVRGRDQVPLAIDLLQAPQQKAA